MSELAIQAFAAVARPLILKYFPPACCIAATRVTIECLRRFGVTAKPKATVFCVSVPEKKLAYVSGPEKYFDFANAASWTKRGTSDGSDGYQGHVVAFAGTTLIDAAFDQSLYALGMWEKFVLVQPADKWPGTFDAQIGAVLTNGESCLIRYIALDDKSFLRAPAWELDHLQPLIAEVCSAMELQMSELHKVEFDNAV